MDFEMDWSSLKTEQFILIGFLHTLTHLGNFGASLPTTGQSIYDPSCFNDTQLTQF